jgi:putative transposase
MSAGSSIAAFGTWVASAPCVPRIPRRLVVDLGSTNHCTWWSHNSSQVFELDSAKRFFLGLVQKYGGRHGILVRAYCLMGTHPHLVVFASKGQTEFSRFWQVVNHLFARWYNRQQKSRRGQVVTQRMKSPMIQSGADGRHVLTVMRYGDLNPVRAGMVQSPKDYDWSSYRHYAFGEPNTIITDEPEYLALGRTAAERRSSYRHLFATPFASALRTKRPDIVDAPFYGDPAWVERHMPKAIGPPLRLS